MRTNSLTFLLLFLAILSMGEGVPAQSPDKDDPVKLTEAALGLYDQGRIDEAIKLASKAVSIKKKTDRDSASYVSALLNLARMKRDKYLALEKKIPPGIRRHEDLGENRETGEDAIRLFEEAIQINDAAGRGASPQSADAKRDLAWLLYNYKYPTREGETKERIDRAEVLFTEAIESSEKARGPDADETLLGILAFGSFYQKYDNYEKAFERFEKFIQLTEKRYGPSDARLIPALLPYAQILYATFRDDEAAAAVSRVEKLTGKKANSPIGELNLYSRSADAVAHRMKIAGAGMNDLWYRTRSRSMSPLLKSVRVSVTVDENGRVTEATAEKDAEGLKKRAEEEVVKWFVRPFSYNGSPRKLRGYLTYSEVR